jgi:hypothetical protein
MEVRVEAIAAAAQVLALTDELQREDFAAFRAKAKEFLAQHQPTSTVVVTTQLVSSSA